VPGILISAAALLKQNPHPTARRRQGRARPQSLPVAARITAWCGQCCGPPPRWQPYDNIRALACGKAAGQPRTKPAAVVVGADLAGGTRDGVSGKVEIGQGIVTALAQIAADELDIDIERVRMIRASTATSPNEGATSGSLSVQQSGRAIRAACAEIRQLFLTAASDRLGVRADVLDIQDGTISGPGNVRTSYWELADQVSLDREANPGAVPKSASRRTLAGHSIQRLDIPDKVFARPRFIHDVALPGLLHGRVLRAEMPAATLVALPEDGARAVAGLIAIVRDGNFVGVVTESEDGAEAALQALRKEAKWSAGEILPNESALAEWLQAQPSEVTVIDEKASPRRGVKQRTIRRLYSRPISPMPRLRRPAPWRNGAASASRSGPIARGVSSSRRPCAGIGTAGAADHGRAFGGGRLLRP